MTILLRPLLGTAGDGCFAFRTDQSPQDLFHFGPGALVGNTADGFLRLLQAQTIPSRHRPQEIPSCSLQVLQQQTACARALLAVIGAAKTDDQPIQTLQVFVLLHISRLFPFGRSGFRDAVLEAERRRHSSCCSSAARLCYTLRYR